MNILTTRCILFCLLCMSACGNKQSVNILSEQVELRVMDTLKIDASSMSLSGTWFIHNSLLYYKDNNLTTVKRFTPEGIMVDKLFSEGRGPNEFLAPPLAFLPLDTSFVYIDYNSNIIHIDSSFEILSSYSLFTELNSISRIQKDLLVRNPDPNNRLFYEFASNENQIIDFQEYCIVPVTMEHVNYNGYYSRSNADKFYKQSYVLAALNKYNGFIVEKVFCNFPPSYHKKMLPNFKDTYITASDSVLYVSFEADPNIFLFDRQLQLQRIISSNKYLCEDYPLRTTFEAAEENRLKDKKNHGYYSCIQYCNNYLFRKYYDRNHNVGIQIFSNNLLVYDEIQREVNFNVVGMIGDCYYALINLDVDNEQYVFLRFRLEGKDSSE